MHINPDPILTYHCNNFRFMNNWMKVTSLPGFWTCARRPPYRGRPERVRPTWSCRRVDACRTPRQRPHHGLGRPPTWLVRGMHNMSTWWMPLRTTGTRRTTACPECRPRGSPASGRSSARCPRGWPRSRGRQSRPPWALQRRAASCCRSRRRLPRPSRSSGPPLRWSGCTRELYSIYNDKLMIKVRNRLDRDDLYSRTVRHSVRTIVFHYKGSVEF